MDTSFRIGEKVTKKSKRIGKKAIKGKAFFPDDIITNILFRLPIKKVMQCRIVCKGWRDLTLDRDFVELHFRCHSNVPMILVANPRTFNKTVDYFLFDKWWELPARKKLINHKFHIDSGGIDRRSWDALFSHAGIAVFENYDSGESRFIVCNPVDPENVTIITLSEDIECSEIYGVFFHPSRKEYCSLWMIKESKNPPKWIKYKMLTLGSNPSMKTISNPYSHRVKRYRSSILFIDKYLYWMLQPENDEYQIGGNYDIMQFDIIAEEFTVLCCPVPFDTRTSYEDTHLLNIDGTLSFLLILTGKITIWRLEDHAQELWRVDNYTFTEELYKGERGRVPKAIALVDGKLVLLCDERLIVYNLMEGTMYYRKTRYNLEVSFQSHQMSLDQEGEAQARKVSKGLITEKQ